VLSPERSTDRPSAGNAEILFLAYFFPPLGGGGVQRTLSLVRYLPEEGLLPTVITGPAGAREQWGPPDGSLMDLIPERVSVHRAPAPAPGQSGRWRNRAERWLFVPKPFASWWVRVAVQLGERVTTTERLIVATMSPFESGEAARQLSERLGIPWIADLRDPWALDEMQVYPSAIHRRLELRRMERLLSSASAIVMNTPEAAAALRAALPRLKGIPVATITNGFDSSDYDAPAPVRSDARFRIVHTGSLHTDTGLWLRKRSHRLLGGARSNVDILTRSHTYLLQALERWFARRPEARDNVELLLAGNTTEEDRTAVAESSVASVVSFAGYVSHSESVRLVRGADLLFLPLHGLPAGERSRIVPGKTYEYMAAARPILAAVPDGDARDFLERSGSAFVCRPDDLDAMTRILDMVFDGWARGEPVCRSDAAYVAGFERRRLAREFGAVLSESLPERSQAPPYVATEVRRVPRET
jgi:glycosyltransferase involved in cell wall biosynthesis